MSHIDDLIADSVHTESRSDLSAKWVHSSAGAGSRRLTRWMKGFRAFIMARSTRTMA